MDHPDGMYFIVAEKPMAKGLNYADRRDVRAVWYKLTFADDDHPDEVPYRFQPIFTRSYARTPKSVDAILAKEATLQPHQ